MPGPRARTVELRLLQGTNTGADDLNRPIAPETGFPPAPVWFQPEAASLYHDTVRRLGEINVASEVDTDMLISYIMGVMILRDCERAFSRVGVARSHKFKTWEATHRRVAAMQKDLGLTPAARSGMRIKPNEPTSAVKQMFAS
jgi:phage terminase small subunit